MSTSKAWRYMIVKKTRKITMVMVQMNTAEELSRIFRSLNQVLK